MKKLTISSKPSNILEVEHFLQKMLVEFDLPDNRFPEILVSLTEAVNNAIIHGNKEDETKVVKINCGKEENERIYFTITDEGKGFNPKEIPDPTQGERLSCCGGRGVYIMQQLADEISFKKNGTCVEMVFKL